MKQFRVLSPLRLTVAAASDVALASGLAAEPDEKTGAVSLVIGDKVRRDAEHPATLELVTAGVLQDVEAADTAAADAAEIEAQRSEQAAVAARERADKAFADARRAADEARDRAAALGGGRSSKSETKAEARARAEAESKAKKAREDAEAAVAAAEKVLADAKDEDKAAAEAELSAAREALAALPA